MVDRKRGRRGEGSVRLKGNTWYGKFSYTDPKTNRSTTVERRLIGAKSERDARHLMREMQKQAEMGELVTVKTLKVGQLLEEFLAARENGLALVNGKTAGPRTLALARQYAAYVLRDPIAKMNALGVIADDVKAFLVRLRDKGGQNGKPLTNAVTKTRLLLGQAFAYGRPTYGLPRNPVEEALKVGASGIITTTSHRAENGDDISDRWETDDVRRLIETLEADDRSTHPLALLLMLRTGLRKGEAYGLRLTDLNDIDGPRPTLTVRQSNSTDLSGRKRITTPKTKGSGRTIPLTPESVETIKKALAFHAKYSAVHPKEWAASLKKDGGQRYLFTTKKGESQSVNNCNRHLRRTCEQLGIPILSPHACRATYTTHLIMQDVPLPRIASLLGHTTTQTLQRYYNKLRPTDTVAPSAGY